MNQVSGVHDFGKNIQYTPSSTRKIYPELLTYGSDMDYLIPFKGQRKTYIGDIFKPYPRQYPGKV